MMFRWVTTNPKGIETYQKIAREENDVKYNRVGNSIKK